MNSCGTGQAYPMPMEDTLKKFYSGFLFAASPNYYQPVLASAKRLFPIARFHRNKIVRFIWHLFLRKNPWWHPPCCCY
jgi:hypothetical protein